MGHPCMHFAPFRTTGRYTVPLQLPRPCVDLMSKLLVVDQLKRITIPQALPYLQSSISRVSLPAAPPSPPLPPGEAKKRFSPYPTDDR